MPSPKSPKTPVSPKTKTKARKKPAGRQGSKKVQPSVATKKTTRTPAIKKTKAITTKRSNKVAGKSQTNKVKAKKKNQPDHRRLVRLALYLTLLFTGLTLLIGGSFYLLYRQTILSFKVAPVYQVTAEERASAPVRIVVPSAQIELEIIPAQIEGGVWQTSDTAATHLATSARPGEKSNVVVYGHNRRQLFAPLHQVQVGDALSLTSQDGHVFEYKVDSIQTVTPDNIDVVLPTDKEELTVYTCTGFLDSKRLVIKAIPVSVNYSL